MSNEERSARVTNVASTKWADKFGPGLSNTTAMERKLGSRSEQWATDFAGLGDITPEMTDDLMIIAVGESNAGGAAANASALYSWETDARPELPIWKVNSPFGFESLDLGVNNNLVHAGLDSTTHGWELGLANHCRIGSFGATPAMYVQTATGGSLVAEHVSPGTGWTQFATRVAAAKAARPTTRFVLIVSLGINDALLGSPPSAAAYKAAMESRIAAWRGETAADALVLLVKLPAAYDANGYSTALQEIADAEPTKTKAISIASLPISGNHWTDAGYRQLSNRFIKPIVDYFSLADSPLLTFNKNADTGTSFMRPAFASPQYAVSDQTIDVTQAFTVASELYADAGGLVVVLAETAVETSWPGAEPYLIGWFYNPPDIYVATQGGVVAYNEAISLPAWIRARKSGNDLIVEKSTNGGTSWTAIHTRSGILSGKTTARLKIVTAYDTAATALLWRS